MYLICSCRVVFSYVVSSAEEHNTGNKCKVTVKDFFSKNETLQEIPSTSLLRVIEMFFPNEKYFQQHGAVIHSQGPHFWCE